jgi:DNA-binding CsgD family transcriptional regulator
MAPPKAGPDYRPLVHEVARLGGDLSQVWPEFDARLRPLLGYDASTFSTIDPATLLWTSRSVIGMESSPDRERRVLLLEFRGDDLNSFPNLLMQQMPIGSLWTASGGNLARTIRYEDLLRGLDLSDEMRAVIRSENLNWGAMTLYRRQPAEPFLYKELRAVRDALEPMGELLRLRMLQAAADNPGPLDRPPGVLRVSAEGAIEETSPAAAGRLEAVDDPSAIAGAVVEVVSAYNGGDALAHATLPAGEEGSVTLHAATGGDGKLVIVVEEDRLVALDQRVADGYGLTDDEAEILGFYAQGRTTRTIAQILGIDAFAVQASLISMFEKTGTKNRADFLATIWADHFEGRFQAGAQPSPYGFFVE